ncbi:hypothetical protein IW261DRAFT_1524702 [Armillaria novae-zelandiae]|uniref:Uncharacterized protein n=1 Tax=Armillaria novae-zelandiae TaxID=153914 RepID=A0AA39NEP0_9AGAR|nr:hypothetical protein IW261DRAFT_1524702 [Armillaria novae-zelandiae]
MDTEVLDISSDAPKISTGGRYCASCKKPMSDDVIYKSCPPCLAKKREYQRRASQRKKERMGIVENAGLKRKAEDEVLDAKTKKKRVRQILQEVQVSESWETTTKASGGAFVVIKDQPKLANACHSVISVLSINHKKRTKLVSKDLLSFAGLKFDRNENIFNGKHLPGTYTCIFKCKCQSKEPSQEQEALRRRTSDLSSWVVSSRSKSSEGPCSGRITVVTEDDDCHPLGISGQKITVTVMH